MTDASAAAIIEDMSFDITKLLSRNAQSPSLGLGKRSTSAQPLTARCPLRFRRIPLRSGTRCHLLMSQRKPMHARLVAEYGEAAALVISIRTESVHLSSGTLEGMDNISAGRHPVLKKVHRATDRYAQFKPASTLRYSARNLAFASSAPLMRQKRPVSPETAASDSQTARHGEPESLASHHLDEERRGGKEPVATPTTKPLSSSIPSRWSGR